MVAALSVFPVRLALLTIDKYQFLQSKPLKFINKFKGFPILLPIAGLVSADITLISYRLSYKHYVLDKMKEGKRV